MSYQLWYQKSIFLGKNSSKNKRSASYHEFRHAMEHLLTLASHSMIGLWIFFGNKILTDRCDWEPIFFFWYFGGLKFLTNWFSPRFYCCHQSRFYTVPQARKYFKQNRIPRNQSFPFLHYVILQPSVTGVKVAIKSVVAKNRDPCDTPGGTILY